MKIGVIGLWHTGEIYSTCLAELGNTVIGIDEDTKIVENLNRGLPPLAEPRLNALIKKNLKTERLSFTNDLKRIKDCDILWVTIDTPVNEYGEADTHSVFECIKHVLPYLKDGVLIVMSSQLPAGTSSDIVKLIKGRKFGYAYIPENFRLGDAVASFMNPSWIVIGLDDMNFKDKLVTIFKGLENKIIFMSVISAEMVKHATNAFLATSLCLIYDIADICEAVGADVTEVARALRADQRIGPEAYLDASAGFSGGHLERELHYLQKIAKSKKINIPVIAAAVRKNENRKKIVFEKISPHVGSLKGKTITFFGITYKSGTPTLSNSLPIRLAREMLNKGSKVNLCDPRVNEDEITKEIKADKQNYSRDPYESVKESHVIVCITPWEELKKLNFRKISELMKKPKVFFDARNYFLDLQNIIEKSGIKYIGVGRQT